MRLSRRHMLMASLGATQMGLLDGGRIPRLRAQGNTGGPSKLLVIFVRGGWMPSYFFNPMGAAAIDRIMPEPISAGGEPAFYRSEWVKNLDGTEDADAGSPMPRIRVPWLFDETRYAAGLPHSYGDRTPLEPGINATPNGYAWRHFNLWENSCVVHGVDHGTAAHLSGIISAMSGAPGGEYRSPAMQAVVANAFYNQLGDGDRVLPSVAINTAPDPNPFNLPSIASPVHLLNIGGLQDTLSMRGGQWRAAQRDLPLQSVADWEEQLSATVPSSQVDNHIRARLRKLKGLSTPKTDQMLNSLYDGVGGISKVLAKDVMAILEATPGTEHITNSIYWGSLGTPYGISITTNTADSGPAVEGIELALKLLKSNLSSAVTLRLSGISDYNFDTHGVPEGEQFTNTWATMEEVGRILGEMKLTPTAGGSTLLDDTLVVVHSDFARTWPHAGGHWPVNSVVLAGGGINTNRMIGAYDTDAPSFDGYYGTPVDIRNIETNVVEHRPPKTADIVATIMTILGIENFFIPGGYGEVLGVRQG
jgi:Protein of unknown function (DUF1501)